jgi:hypothetical protein
MKGGFVSDRQSQSPLNDIRSSFYLALFMAQVHAWPVLVFLRRPGTIGSHYARLAAVCAIFWIGLFSRMANVQTVIEAEVMGWFTILYLFLLLVHALKRAAARRKGFEWHSQFVGVSACGYSREPLLALAAGLILLSIVPVLGMYLVWAAISLAMLHAYIQMRDRAIARGVRDARIEQEILASHLQKGGQS